MTLRPILLSLLLVTAGVTISACDDAKLNEMFDGKRKLPNFPGFAELPVTELYSMRVGATLSVRHLW